MVQSLAMTRHHLLASVREAHNAAIAYALQRLRPEHHWHGALFTDAGVTASYIFMRTWFRLDLGPLAERLTKHIQRQQRADGSWGISGDSEGSVSTTIEAYLALKIMGLQQTSHEMIAARDFILDHGGIPSARGITRTWLATFGLVSWNDLPFTPAEVILIPCGWPFNIYAFASWARALLVPLLIVAHHRPIFALPNGLSSENEFLDELWPDPQHKRVDYGPSLWSLLLKADWLAFLIMVADVVFSFLGRIGVPPPPFLRPYAIRQCLHWTLSHFEPSGMYAPGLIPNHVAVLAIYLEGVSLDDPRMQRATSSLKDTYLVHQGDESFVRPCTTPVWDTILMCQGIMDAPPDLQRPAGLALALEHVDKGLEWTRKRQNLTYTSDWSATRPFIPGGGFSIQYCNTWNPDIDDTAAAITAFLTRDPRSLGSNCVQSALEWILGMQSSNGGWAAFEADNDHTYLTKLPFSDMPACLLEPPNPDVTAHAVEVLGLVLKVSENVQTEEKSSLACLSHDQVMRMRHAIARGVKFLSSEQEVNGSWFGRWQCNYVYGTGAVLGALAKISDYHKGPESIQIMIDTGIDFLKSWQNADGGWGESTNSYFWSPSDPDAEATRPLRSSTASQTAWALMGLLAHLSIDDPCIRRGISFLLSTQHVMSLEASGATSHPESEFLQHTQPLPFTKAGTWSEDVHTGTGLPGWISMRYEYYPHYFPMIAFGRFLAKAKQTSNRTDD